MDALQVVPAAQIAGGTVNPVPAWTDAGEAPPHVFGMMFDQAATAVASRGLAFRDSPDPRQSFRQQGIPLRFAGGLAAQPGLPDADGSEAYTPVSREREEVVTTPAAREAKTRPASDTGRLQAAMGEEREVLATGGPLWVLPEQLLVKNGPPSPLLSDGEQGGPPLPAHQAQSVPPAAYAGGNGGHATGMFTRVETARDVEQAQSFAEPTGSNGPAGAMQVEMVSSRDVLRGPDQAMERQANAAEILTAVEVRTAGHPTNAVMAGPDAAETAAVSQRAPEAASVGTGKAPADGTMEQATESVARDVTGDAAGLYGDRVTVPSFSKPAESSGGEATMKTMHDHGAEKAVNGDREGMSRRNSLELKAEVKGEAVLRQVPWGATAANPARTTGTGAVSSRDVAQAAAGRPDPTARTESVVAGKQAEPAPEASGTAATGGLSGENGPFSSRGGAQQRHDTGTGDGSRHFPGNPAGFGNVETPVRGLEETRAGRVFGGERERLHEEVLSQVRERLANHSEGSGDGRVTLRLNPRELGELQLNVRMEDRRMSIEVTAQNPVVKEALLQNLDQLKDTLSRQNIQMERFEVTTGTGQQGTGQSFREGRQSGYRQDGDTRYLPTGYFREETVTVPVTGWEQREHSLVDMRL